jgi:hypothetical protein
MANTITPDQNGLVAALCLAQAQFKAVEKTKKGARSMYAPLEDVLSMVRPILAGRGLALTQTTFVEGDWLMLRTALRHTGGDVIAGEYPVCALGKPPQEIGSALTYARRYALLAICGIQPGDEDDDGEHATQAARNAAPQKQQPAPDLSKVKAYVTSIIARIAAIENFAALDDVTTELFSSSAWKKLSAEHPAEAERVQKTIAAKTDALVEAEHVSL